MGAADPAKDLIMTTNDDLDPPDTASPTEHVLSELQLYGWRPFDDEPDPRPLPEGNTVAGAVADIFDALVATLSAILGPLGSRTSVSARRRAARKSRLSIIAAVSVLRLTIEPVRGRQAEPV